MRHTLNEKTAPRFAQYGVRVWGLDAKADIMETARKAIDRTAEFFYVARTSFKALRNGRY